MECLYCKAQMRRGHVPFSLDRHSYHISWNAVPAWVCEQCGEALFEAAEVDIIQEALSALDHKTARLTGQTSIQPKDNPISASKAS